MPFEISRVAFPFSRVAPSSEAVIRVLKLPFADAVMFWLKDDGVHEGIGDAHGNAEPPTSHGHGVGARVTVKSYRALNTPLSEAFCGSATPLIVPENTRPCANITKVPLATPLCGAAIEKTPSEFAAHGLTDGEHAGAGGTVAEGQGLAAGVKTPAYVPTTLILPGYTGPPLIA